MLHHILLDQSDHVSSRDSSPSEQWRELRNSGTETLLIDVAGIAVAPVISRELVKKSLS